MFRSDRRVALAVALGCQWIRTWPREATDVDWLGGIGILWLLATSFSRDQRSLSVFVTLKASADSRLPFSRKGAISTAPASRSSLLLEILFRRVGHGD